MPQQTPRWIACAIAMLEALEDIPEPGTSLTIAQGEAMGSSRVRASARRP